MDFGCILGALGVILGGILVVFWEHSGTYVGECWGMLGDARGCWGMLGNAVECRGNARSIGMLAERPTCWVGWEVRMTCCVPLIIFVEVIV